MKSQVGINGFGRIGRAFLRASINDPALSVVAINDLGDVNNLAYLLQYDSVYRVFQYDVKAKIINENEQYLTINTNAGTRDIRVYKFKEPKDIPWGTHNIDVVVESTGLFTSFDKAGDHLTAGAKRVVISAPGKTGDDSSVKGETVLMGINEERLSYTKITSNASCTTNASSPVMAVLDKSIGIEKAMLSTVHAYTASQSIVDGPNKKDFREGRAGASNIVPSSTGAAKAVTLALPQFKNLFDGIAIRVPVPAGSIADITFISKRPTTVQEVNKALYEASIGKDWQGILAVTNEELVSSDILGLPYASIVDMKMTRVVGGNLVKVLAWYDNEVGYTNTLISHVKKVSKL